MTIERILVSTLNEEDLKVLNEILKGIIYYQMYYERLTWFKSSLDMKEYSTLKLDFRDFYNEVINDGNRVAIYKILSFMKSLKLIFKNSTDKVSKVDEMFTAFLIDSIIALALILGDLINKLHEPG